jgi:glycerol-3-phosphate dehydrogenase (NAD(P)+)
MSKQGYPIAVLGAGAWGTALAQVLANNGHRVNIWDVDEPLLNEINELGRNTKYLPDLKLSKLIHAKSDLKETLADTNRIVLAIPSHAFNKVLERIEPLLTEQHGLIAATKGIEPESGKFLHQVAEHILKNPIPYAVLSGPSFAKEVALGLPTAVTIASAVPSFAMEVARYFHNDVFATYTTEDVIGVQLGAVVKNVLAVAVGISDGLNFGSNARAALLTRGLAEMRLLGDTLGARQNTLMGLSGFGDVILTCTDNQSRNRRFGLALAEGLSETEALKKIGHAVEAVYNIEQLCQLAKRHGILLPVSEQVFNIIKHGVDPRAALKSLFASAPQTEI